MQSGEIDKMEVELEIVDKEMKPTITKPISITRLHDQRQKHYT